MSCKWRKITANKFKFLHWLGIMLVLAMLLQDGRSADMAPQFKPLAYKAARVADARLYEADGVSLVLSEYLDPNGIQLSRLVIGDALQDSGAKPEPLVSFMDRPGWDAIPAENKTWRIVSFRAGSAVAPLVVQTTGQETGRKQVDTANSRGVFLFPRFLRHAGSSPAITAVDVSAGYRITLYPQQPDGHYAPRQALAAPHSGILQDARLLALDDGFLLLAQRFQPGDFRKTTIGGETKIQRAGVVEGLRLDREFKPIGAVWEPFGSKAVFQFDADARNGRVAVFASTLAGWRLAIIPTKDILHAEPLRFEANTREPLSSPSILAVDSGMILSLLVHAGSDQAKLWLGRWQP